MVGVVSLFEKFVSQILKGKTIFSLDKETIIKLIYSIPVLIKHAPKVKLMYYLVNDFLKGEYRDIELQTVAQIVAALIYLITPTDAIPDWLGPFGILDDVEVINMVWNLLEVEICKYGAWKLENLKRKGASWREIEDFEELYRSACEA